MSDQTRIVPARMLNEWVYCPRLAILEWVHGDWASNAETVEGSHVHRRVDRPGKDLPEATEPDPGFVTRSLWLTSEADGITAKMDVVEEQDGELVAIDTKRGECPDPSIGVWPADRIQVGAQALVLRAHGHPTRRGAVYYAGSRRRVDVPVDDALLDEVREAARTLRATAESGVLPPPLVDSPKCPRCSLVGICLPDETRLLQAQDTSAASEPRQLAAPRYEGLPLYVVEQGATVGTSDGQLVVSRGKTELARVRVRDTSHVALFGNVHVTPASLRTAMDDDIPMAFFSYGGWFRGFVQGHSHKNVVLRLGQFELARDENRRLEVAKAIVRGKIRNQRTLLRRNDASDDSYVVDELARIAREIERVTEAGALLGAEGNAAKLYFRRFAALLTGRGGEGAPAFEWTARSRRPPRDPVNALLSFAYSLLSKDCFVALSAVGFDPYLGVYHTPRYGKPALALDLMEEFRPLVADSVVLSAVNQGEVDANSFVVRADGCNLTDHGRRSFLRAYERRMDTLVTHPTFGYRLSWRRMVELQARILAKVCIGELATYAPMETR